MKDPSSICDILIIAISSIVVPPQEQKRPSFFLTTFTVHPQCNVLSCTRTSDASDVDIEEYHPSLQSLLLVTAQQPTTTDHPISHYIIICTSSSSSTTYFHLDSSSLVIKLSTACCRCAPYKSILCRSSRCPESTDERL